MQKAAPEKAIMEKSADAFRTISEVAEELDLPQHVLRFWETRFSFIRPMKRAGGRRFYRPQDISVLRGVRTLLHDEGYTIKGVQKLHKEQGVKRLLAAGDGGTPDKIDGRSDHGHLNGESISADGRNQLSAALADLQSAKAHLDGLLHRR